MNNEPIKILNDEQSALVAELTTAYGIEPEDIMFFRNDPKPFLTYEATCAIANQLADLHDINIVPTAHFITDSLAFRCTLTLSDGKTRSAVGVVNLGETIDGKALTEQQITQLASSRAIRNALKTAGIDLIKRYYLAKNGMLDDLEFKSNQVSALAQAHILGKEAGLIVGEDKAAWYRLLWNRYEKMHSNELSQDQLADFIAVLKTLVPQRKVAA